MSSSLGVHRIRHSSHHLFEIMLPGSLAAHRDGWKICVHIRLVHAATRRLLLQRSGWDTAKHGTPISMAHLALASSNYSAGLLQYVRLLGVPVDERSRRGFTQIWRYVGTLLGTPDALLFEGRESDLLRYREIAERAEPRPDVDAIAVANAVVQVLPDLIGQTDPAHRAATISRTYRLTRALLGKETADLLRFPNSRIPYSLVLRRAHQRIRRLRDRLHPPSRAKTQARHLALLLEYAVLPDLAYTLPPIAPAAADPPLTTHDHATIQQPTIR
ncbi:MAG: oxygenase MpaB family protein [Defluviicoccus sp.]|nr:oxygenase MpaB family protein [Defluviicoccus sp.]